MIFPPTDARPYADFILRYLLKPLPAFPGASRAVSETELALDGDTWFWADDNAKVLELLAIPEIWRERPADITNILEFIRAMCDGPFIFRRIASPRLVTIRNEGGRADFLHSLLNIQCDLARGTIALGMRFHDVRTAHNVKMTGNYVRFCYRGKVFTVGIEDNIRNWAIEEIDDGVRLIWRAEIEFGGMPVASAKRRLGVLTYTSTIHANTMFVDVEAALEIDPGVEVSDVVLTFGYDDLSHNKNHVRYENIRIAFPNAPPLMYSAGKEKRRDLLVEGANYWCIAQASMTSGFALAVHSLPRAGSPLHAIRVTVQRDRRLRSTVSEHRFAGAWCGTRLVAAERKIITSGGFYDEAASYATMLGRYSRRADEGTAPIDLSISYDYGAEVKAFARCFRSLSGVTPPVADPALRDELRGMVDHFHSVYQTHFTIPFRTNKSTIFSRSIAFMAFAYADMLVSTNAPMYRTALREACEIILAFERQNRAVDGSWQSGFLMGQNHDEVPHVDCHSACLLALTRATVLLDEPGWLPNIDRGLAAFCLTKSEIVFSGMQKVDVVGVDYKRPYKRRTAPDTFWNFKAGLTLRLFNALRATRHSGLREVWERHAPRLTPLEMLLRHNIAQSLRQRDDTIEILTSMRSGETNSETQPWVALALIGEASQDSLESRLHGNGLV